MKKIIFIFLLFVFACDDVEDSPIYYDDVEDEVITEKLSRCNKNVIEHLNEFDEWIPVYDCEKYVVSHSGVVCPRVCCVSDGIAQCMAYCEED